MENSIFNAQEDIPSQNSAVVDGIPSQSQTSLNPPMESDSLDFGHQPYAISPVLSALPKGSCGFGQLPSWNINRDCSMQMGSYLMNNIGLQEQLSSNNSLPNARTDAENLDNLAIRAAAPAFPLEQFRPYMYSTDLNSSFATLADCRYDGGFGGMGNRKWDFEKFPDDPEPCIKMPGRTGFDAYSSIGSTPMLSNHDHENDFHYEISKYSNELSLSLATSRQGIISGTVISDKSSEIRLDSEQASCGSKDLSLGFPCNGLTDFSRLILGSRYLHVVQDILAQVASYSLENVDLELVYLARGVGSGSNSAFPPPFRDPNEFPGFDGNLETEMEPVLHRRVVEAKKAQLLTLLQAVDDRYNHCLDEIHTVVSAFHAATELAPQLHTRFALQTISLLNKNLRERISNRILEMGSVLENGCERRKEQALENSFIQQQWALQQLGRKNHQLWRPQRGLPERSVLVLRAWMFQNFLHPYPKDAEKHLLAIKSGLTRSQVSNWFINARVRLWKPMIEDMYTELNRRKAQGKKEGSRRGQISIDNKFSIN